MGGLVHANGRKQAHNAAGRNVGNAPAIGVASRHFFLWVLLSIRRINDVMSDLLARVTKCLDGLARGMTNSTRTSLVDGAVPSSRQ